MSGQMKNRNGNMSMDEFLKLIHTNQTDNYMRKFSTLRDKCPPKELIDKDTICFYCCDDWRNCLSQVKESKDHYKVKNKKYMKDDLD